MILANLIAPILAAVFGGIAGIYLHGRITKDVKILLAFSGSYLFGLTIMHLLPAIFGHGIQGAGYFILLGFIFQLILDYYSKGIEHGHLHASDSVKGAFPLGIYLSLCIHSLIEGMPLQADGLHLSHEHVHGESLLLGISVHKIPEAIALSALLYHHFESKAKVLVYITFYALTTPLGVLLGQYILLHSVANPELRYAQILAVAVGIFIHVSTTIIFEAEEHHRFNFKKGAAIALGLLLVLLM